MSPTTQFFGMIIFFVVLGVALYRIFKIPQDVQQNKVSLITLGMPEDEMLAIMGNRYNKSLLKNNRVKYEWRYSNGGSYGSSFKGFSTRFYSGVRKVDIYCKNGFVKEVKPYNL